MTDILVSRGFGAGWSTWCHGSKELQSALRTDPVLVELVRKKKHFSKGEEVSVAFKERAQVLAKDEDVECLYFGGVDDLVIESVPEGTEFYIHECDGSESLKFRDSDEWDVA